jgi:hypothetical protein
MHKSRYPRRQSEFLRLDVAPARLVDFSIEASCLAYLDKRVGVIFPESAEVPRDIHRLLIDQPLQVRRIESAVGVIEYIKLKPHSSLSIFQFCSASCEHQGLSAEGGIEHRALSVIGMNLRVCVENPALAAGVVLGKSLREKA